RQPGAQIQQAAALAAERAKRFAVTLQFSVAGRTVDARRTHRDTASTLSAAAQHERHVRLRLCGPGRHAVPGEAADIAAMVTAADLGVQAHGCWQRDAHQLQWIVARASDVEGDPPGNLIA